MPVKDPFLAGVLATVPEADRAKAEARLIELEDGGLRQADYSRVSAEAQAIKKQADDLYAQNLQWFTEHEAALKEVDALRARVASGDPNPVPRPTPTPTVPNPDLMTKKEIQDLFEVTERGAVGFIAEANALTLRHFKEFGDILNITDLLTDPRVQKIGIQGVYQDKFKEQITAKAKAADDARAEAFREEGRKAERERLAASRGPGYPVMGNEASSLDALEASRTAGEKALKPVSDDYLVQEYARLSSTRGGSSP